MSISNDDHLIVADEVHDPIGKDLHTFTSNLDNALAVPV